MEGWEWICGCGMIDSWIVTASFYLEKYRVPGVKAIGFHRRGVVYWNAWNAEMEACLDPVRSGWIEGHLLYSQQARDRKSVV